MTLVIELENRYACRTRDRGERVPSKNLQLLEFGFCVSGAQLHFVAFHMGWA